MFILKSTHAALIAAEKSRCEAVVAQMQEQIADLRRLVFVPAPSHVEAFSSREANAVIDGAEVMPKKDVQAEDDALAEANRILSGEYDNVEESW